MHPVWRGITYLSLSALFCVCITWWLQCPDFDDVGESDFDYDKIDLLYYFPNNRWDIKTQDEILIKLPEKNYLSALNFANKVMYNKMLINSKMLDLRISDKLIVSNE